MIHRIQQRLPILTEAILFFNVSNKENISHAKAKNSVTRFSMRRIFIVIGVYIHGRQLRSAIIATLFIGKPRRGWLPVLSANV